MSGEAEQIIGLYDRHAADWDRQRSGGSLFEKPWIDRFLALLPSRASVLDIGCGCGDPITRYLIQQGYRVTGVDASPALIDICRSRFPDHEWIVADMRGLALERRFDGVLAWDSFFHLCPDDQPSMFPVFRRHTATGGALLFTSGPRHGEVIATWQGRPLYHGSLAPAEYRSLLDQNGFDVISHVIEDPNCGEHTVWLAQLR
jgi:SAM-dependent methyltransferase